MRIPCVRQQDHNDCGPAVLATVCRHHRLRVGIGRVRELCRTDGAGSTLLGLKKAAEALGFTAKACKGTLPALQHIPGPFVAHVLTEVPGSAPGSRSGHFVAVFKVGPTHVELADPARGVQRLSVADFQAMWTGAIMLLVPTPRLESTEHSQAPWRRFARLLTGKRAILFECALASILFTGLGLATSFYAQALVDRVLAHGLARQLHFLSLGMLLLTMFRVGFHVVESYLLAHVAQRVDLQLSVDYLAHVLRQPLTFFQTRHTGEILGRLADAQKIRQALSATVLGAAVDAVFVVSAGAILLWYDARLAALTLAAIPLFLLVVWAHRGAIRRAQRELMERRALLETGLVEVVSGAAVIKAARAEEQAQLRLEERFMEQVGTGWTLAMLSLSTSSLGLLIQALAGLGIWWYGGTLVLRGELSLGQLVFFHSILAHMLEPLGRLARANLELEQALVAAERVGEVLDLAPEQAPGAERVRPTQLRGELRLEGVKFRYGYRDWVLDGVDLVISPGQTVALVGRSGSGKTTITKLLAGFHQPTEGRILVDGQDLRDLDLDWLRSRLGVVDQECLTFSSTIRDNIRLGRPQASFEQVQEAARQAGAHEFIERLPERYETLLGERGAGLSGGQRQRISIARAILGEPQVLLLDEATSHLDSATEREVQRTLREVSRGRTTVVVAHRLSTIQHADKIVVLEGGKVVEEGTHELLLALGGTYALMWAEQTGGGEEAPPCSRRRRTAVLREDELVVWLDDEPTRTRREVAA